jgi:hypothetical protein
MNIEPSTTAADSSSAAISVGSRVKLSALGAARCPRIAEKQGVVVGVGRYSNSLRVLLDGSKLPVSLHRDYLDEVLIASNELTRP